MKKLTFISLIALTVLFASGCADAVHVKACLPSGDAVGFWYGVWHGMIAVIAFIVSLFNDNVAIYAVNNNGGWYDFGYVGGLGFIVRLVTVIIKGLTK
jgi:hypothetical protein